MECFGEQPHRWKKYVMGYVMPGFVAQRRRRLQSPTGTYICSQTCSSKNYASRRHVGIKITREIEKHAVPGLLFGQALAKLKYPRD